jgi:hypothetical protein
MTIIPEDDAHSGLQRIKDNPNDEEALMRLSQQYIPVGERRLTEARRYRIELVRRMRAGGTTWRRLAELSGLSDDYLQREVKRADE